MTAQVFFADLLILILVGLGIFWLRTRPFREKKTKEPERTAKATLLSKKVQSGNPVRSGRSQGGYTYVALFRLEDGQELEVYAHDYEWAGLKEGTNGSLTWKGPYYVSFETEE